jgi:hypothetical protein
VAINPQSRVSHKAVLLYANESDAIDTSTNFDLIWASAMDDTTANNFIVYTDDVIDVGKDWRGVERNTARGNIWSQRLNYV